MSELTIKHFAITGWQDANNAISIDEFDMRSDLTLAEIVRAGTPDMDTDEGRDAWIAQNEFEGLDPVECWEAWRDAWRAAACDILARYSEVI